VPGHHVCYNSTGSIPLPLATTGIAPGTGGTSSTRASTKSYTTSTNVFQPSSTKFSSSASSIPTGRLPHLPRNVNRSYFHSNATIASTNTRIASGSVHVTPPSTASVYRGPTSPRSSSTAANTGIIASSVKSARLSTGYKYCRPSVTPKSMLTSASIALPRSSSTLHSYLSTGFPHANSTILPIVSAIHEFHFHDPQGINDLFI